MPVLAVVSVFTGLIIILKWSLVKRKLYDFRLRRAIKKLGKKVLRNVAVSDGLDGLVYVDYLVLTPESILLVYIRRYQGVIFAGDNIDFWTQVIDRGSFKFDNPLVRMDEDIISIRTLLSGSKVGGLMVFTDESEFPKGRPDRIISLSDLRKKACNKSDLVPDKLQEDWDRLVQAIG